MATHPDRIKQPLTSKRKEEIDEISQEQFGVIFIDTNKNICNLIMIHLCLILI